MSATYAANVSISGTLTVLNSNVSADILSGTISTALGGLGSANSIAYNSYNSAILMNDGTVRVCGNNEYGQLGLNDLTTRSTVVSVLGISSQAIAVSIGFGHIAILMNDGTVRVTGRNQVGQLGVNDRTTRSTVVSVLGISSQAIAVACGRYHTAILMNDGTVRVCGQNSLYGQLGLNDRTNRSTVVSVLGISSQAIAVACGRFHTAILMNDGTVRVCGYNASGQLGLNDLTDRSTVVPVLGISSQAIAVACGQNHTAILMNDGTVRICGDNSFGQLGLNDLTTRSTVVPVLGISSQAVGVACGFYHTAILMNNGTVRVCGFNSTGQLGQNDVSDRLTVVPVLGISSQAVGVACGFYHTGIVLNNGYVFNSGNNFNGQLGLNDLTPRSTAVPILSIVTNTPTISVSSNLIVAPALTLGLTNPLYQLDLSSDSARKLTTTTWTTGSDETLKTNIESADLEKCVDIISKLDLKYFKWDIPSDDAHSLGWIAQDVEKIFPKAVHTAEAHGIPDFKNLNTDQLIKVMWGALKKLRADLKAQRLS